MARLRTSDFRLRTWFRNCFRIVVRGALPFEIASLLLLVAIVGSVLLARTSKQELAHDDVDPRRIPELSAAGELTPAEIEAASRAQAGEA